jgi:hypothetical protein
MLLLGKHWQAGPLTEAAFRLELIGDALGLLRTSLDRANTLVELISARELSETASQFLRRATHLYLRGCDVETVIMCAAVLEAAYRDMFSDEQMVAHGFTPGIEYRASDYESLARRLRIFSRDDAVEAARLRRARNLSIHDVPAPDLNALEAISVCS